MLKWKILGGTAAIATFMTGSAAFADVTAKEVWTDWKTYMEAFGYKMDATESMSGDTLKVDGIAMVIELPNAEGKVVVNMGEMSFTEQGDGTVAITVPPVMPMSLNIQPKSGEAVDATIDYSQTGLKMIVSGEPNELTYTYTADSLGMQLTNLSVDGKPIDIGKANIVLNNMSGTSMMKVGNLRTLEQTTNIESLTYDADISDPDGNGNFQFNGGLDGLSYSGTGSFPLEMDTTDMVAMMKAGFGFDGTFSQSGSKLNFKFTDKGKTVSGDTSTTDGSLKVSMNESHINYGGTANGYVMNFAGGDIPFPIAVQMAKTGFNLLMPISKGDEEQDFALSITMGDFTMSDIIWGLFDPSAQLPRDPATIAFDVAGKVKLFIDLMDEKQMTAAGAGENQPGELNAVSLNSLTVAAAGAELSGNGAFTFDNTDMTTFDGMPAPTGAVDLKLVGGNGLLDKIVAMGFVPEQQAMGVRMMMGMFAVAGEGEDTLTSKIEVQGNGQISANGQRLK